MNISMRQLRGFLLVANLRNFSRAAEQLHITQAGLSALIRDLEVQFNCRLFDRTTRSVSLTDEGQGLLGPAERIIHELEAAATSMRATSIRTRKLLTIAVTPVTGVNLMPEVCRMFTAINPTVEIRIRDVPQPEIQRLVECGDVDMGLSIFLKPAGGIELRALLDFQLICIAPAGSLYSRNTSRTNDHLPTLAWSQLPHKPLISLPAHTPPQQIVDAYLLKEGQSNSRRPICNSMQTIIAMVAAGHGMAILPSMVMPSCPTSRFDVALLVEPTVPLQFYQISRKGHHLPPFTPLFIDTLIEVVQDLCAT